MPYAIDKPENLPDNVQELSKDKQETWTEIFNSTYKACLDDESPQKNVNHLPLHRLMGLSKMALRVSLCPMCPKLTQRIRNVRPIGLLTTLSILSV